MRLLRTLWTSSRRCVAATLAVALATTALVVTTAPQPAFAAAPCVPAPGKDGAGGTLSGVYNTYYKPNVGTVIAAGSTSIQGTSFTVDTSTGGASTGIAVNDEVLIIQMQDGTFNTSNSSAYGSGGTTGTGYSSIGSAGLYEYAYISAINGTTVTIVGGGAGNGLLNTYTEAAATGSSGQKTFQVIRVPQFLTATLSSSFRAAAWNGATGGVAVLDIATTTNLGGASLYATGDGFRGGAYTVASTTPSSVLNNDYADSVLMNGTGLPGFGSKGEGFLGTPQYLFYYTSFTTPSTPAAPAAPTPAPVANGYPGGDMGMGAPGNAGGGGNDDDAVSNDENTGGGGGSNGGAGGNGGYPWVPNYSGNTAQYSVLGVHTDGTPRSATTGDIGGRGASAINAGDQTPARALLGGGGGAGVNNNGSNNNSYNAYGSSGGVGGGAILLRINATSGSGATIYANGTTGLAPVNDGGGGGGAGGTVIVSSPQSFSGITINVNGAAGTTANATNGTLNQAHGPGGGGGGGIAYATSAVSLSASGGAAGTTTTSALTYGATPGGSGLAQTIAVSQIPGVRSGGECYAGGSTGLLYTGPAGGPTATGSYDGSVPATNNNDFTAESFMPSGATPINSGTVPGAPIGNTVGTGTTVVNVQNSFSYNNVGNGSAVTVTLTATAPTAPSGWTASVCRDNAGAIACGAASGRWGASGTAAATSSTTYSVPGGTNTGTILYWVQYTAPASLTAFTRYDASIIASDAGANSNETHNEFYTGFVVLTKTATVVTTGCPTAPPAGTTCPGGVIKYAIDYRNIMVGGGTGNEGSLTPSPYIATGKTLTPLAITDNISTYFSGLMDTLVAGANGTTTYGDSTAGSTFTGGTVGSSSFTCTVGGTNFSLVAPGVTGTSQGTIYYRVTVK